MSELAEGARLEIVCTSQAYRGFESHSLRQKRFYLNPNRVAFSITIIKYIFVKGNAGIIFDFERPKPESKHWMFQPRDIYGDFIKKQK